MGMHLHAQIAVSECVAPGLIESCPIHALVSGDSTHEHHASGKPITAVNLADRILKHE